MKKLVLIVLGLFFIGVLSYAATEIKKTSMRATSPASGEEMYKAYCASCHGLHAKGDGPAAPALKKMPTDLTMLAKRNNGKFPETSVYNAIQGDPNLPSHGSQDMPVWGSLFSLSTSSDAATVKMRLANLTRFIESLQIK